MADGKTPALKLVIDGKEREISFEELTLSNNLPSGREKRG